MTRAIQISDRFLQSAGLKFVVQAVILHDSTWVFLEIQSIFFPGTEMLFLLGSEYLINELVFTCNGYKIDKENMGLSFSVT